MTRHSRRRLRAFLGSLLMATTLMQSSCLINQQTLRTLGLAFVADGFNGIAAVLDARIADLIAPNTGPGAATDGSQFSSI